MQSAIEELQRELAKLAAEWRGSTNPTYQQALVARYHEVVKRLLSIPEWDGHIGFDALLPDEFLPDALLQYYEANVEHSSTIKP